ncbi:hypothetical protein [Roseofilum casamattae]|uniref:Uncharacterized protein n=1 Tax=Roseofilum casamattae BLCC-M143 TaxID=3022442 RepID=A0ABT7BXH1_9CYAN|nr:hypothetical protein [Roseofilum casamattae]MDJ1183866.1 hypothetical protein [Roseofilum casamattae BLCC-M143]
MQSLCPELSDKVFAILREAQVKYRQPAERSQFRDGFILKEESMKR